MVNTNIGQTTTTGMNTEVSNYKVTPKVLDVAGSQKETYWENPSFTKYLGYYKTIPELRQAINSLATWTAGKGYVTTSENAVILENIKGWGEDSFDSLMQQAIVMKKVNGDAYLEIVRADNDEATLINLKPLNPQVMRTVVDEKGLILRYEEFDPKKKDVKRKYKVNEIFHIVNERTGNEIHGTSVIESCQWVIDARNEAMADWRRILHRSTIRIMYIDADNTTRLNDVKAQYAEAIKKGELLLIPAKKPEAEFEDLQAPPVQNFMEWIRYLENFFYQAVGVPKIILGGSQEF